MDDILCFTAVEFPDDPNVQGRYFWYLCDFDGVSAGDRVIAPLGMHDGLQQGIVRVVRHAAEHDAPYPVYMIKRLKAVKRREENNG